MLIFIKYGYRRDIRHSCQGKNFQGIFVGCEELQSYPINGDIRCLICREKRQPQVIVNLIAVFCKGVSVDKSGWSDISWSFFEMIGTSKACQ